MSRALPFIIPRGLSRIQAAHYVGVSPGTFDRLVEDQLMPRPKRIRARLVYDRVELDSAFDALGEVQANANDFDVGR